jgi:hypothetical protein
MRCFERWGCGSFGFGGCGEEGEDVSQWRRRVKKMAARRGRAEKVRRRWMRRDVRPIVMYSPLNKIKLRN